MNTVTFSPFRSRSHFPLHSDRPKDPSHPSPLPPPDALVPGARRPLEPAAQDSRKRAVELERASTHRWQMSATALDQVVGRTAGALGNGRALSSGGPVVGAARLAPASDGSIRPGEVWRDTDGKPIQAHGGGMLEVNGTYYWYGENRTEGYFNKVGVSCYSSTDLVNWTNRGVVLPKAALPPQFGDTGVCERPKVVYNAQTGKYVMWAHLDANGYGVSEAGVAVSDNPTGPFTLVSHFRPVPSSTFRDMNLFVDDDGQAYVFYAGEENQTMHVVQLNDDYTAPRQPMVEGRTWARIFQWQSREAPAPFKCGDRYYMVTSGCTGWAPNAAGLHVADSPLGPWKNLGNPCTGPGADKTFDGQSTFVFPLPGKPDQFVFMADRWNPQDLGDSRYVWLPFEVKPDGTATIAWRDAWTPTAR